MFSIDGLVTGLDTSSIIEGLLAIQQGQIERLNGQKQTVLTKQSAFSGVEATLISLQNALNRLASSHNNVFDARQAESSDETLLQASASSDAVNGNFVFRVNQLAQAEQRSSQGFASPETVLGEGTLTFQVGTRQASVITLDSTNNTVQGLVGAINDADIDVTASLVNDGTSERILLTSKYEGAANTITVTPDFPSGGTIPDFSGPEVQTASDASLTMGSGPGAITVTSETNVVEDLITGVTLRLFNADANKDVTVKVSHETEEATTAIEDFVDAYNATIKFINDQTRYDSVTETGGPLLGVNSINEIQQQLFNQLSRVVPNVDTDANRLSAIGIRFNDRGELQIESAALSKALNGELEGVDMSDIRRLFALDGQTDNPNIDFLLGSSKTLASDDPYQVVITSAARQATVTGSSLASSVVIDSSNNVLNLSLDGSVSGNITLAEGTYTLTELAAHVQAAINQDTALSGTVSVSVNGDQLQITSDIYGSSSKISGIAGTAASALGFTGIETSNGQDVSGHFLVDGQMETATGNGRILTGEFENENTSGIQLQVTLTPSQVGTGVTSDLTITRGIASELDKLIADLSDTDDGKLKNISESLDGQIESIDASIERINRLIESKQEQLIRDFAALERTVSELQNQSAFLVSQFSSVSTVAGGFG